MTTDQRHQPHVTDAEQRALCTTCADTSGTRRYCAAGRCYCGHPTCHAYATYVHPEDLQRAADHAYDARAREQTREQNRDRSTDQARSRSRWDDRDDDTWIDRI